MSQRRSGRIRRPASRVPAQDAPPQRRRRLTVPEEEVAVAISAPQPPVQAPAVAVPSTNAVPASAVPASAAIPPELINQIVAKVTAEVTKNLQPLLQVQSSVSAASSSHGPPVQPPAQQPPVQHESLVSAAVVGAAEAITGQSSTVVSALSAPPAPGISEVFTPAALPLDARIPARVKAKIWANEYIDFATLLINNTPSPNYQLTINQSSDDGPPTLSIEPSTKTNKINHIAAWSAAFRFFVAVYTTRYPHEAPALMKYGDVIHELSSRGHQWRYYDENFRFLRQTCVSSLPWDQIHTELWLRACTSSQAAKKVPSQDNSQKANQGISVPKGFCVKFHKGYFCAGCSYKHLCYKCNGSHKVTNCNFRPSNGGQNTKATGAPKSTPAHSSKSTSS